MTKQTVHVDCDDAQWGRVAGDGRVLAETKRRVLVEVDTIRAAIWVKKEDVSIEPATT
jgi:hypothetical protein